MTTVEERRCNPASATELERRWRSVREGMPAAGLERNLLGPWKQLSQELRIDHSKSPDYLDGYLDPRIEQVRPQPLPI
jgi:hypothetical protein